MNWSAINVTVLCVVGALACFRCRMLDKEYRVLWMYMLGVYVGSIVWVWRTLS